MIIQKQLQKNIGRTFLTMAFKLQNRFCDAEAYRKSYQMNLHFLEHYTT